MGPTEEGEGGWSGPLVADPTEGFNRNLLTASLKKQNSIILIDPMHKEKLLPVIAGSENLSFE